MPSLAAATLPMPSRLPASNARVRSGEKKLRTHAHAEDDERQQHQHLRRVVDEEVRGLLETAAGDDGQLRHRPGGKSGHASRRRTRMRRAPRSPQPIKPLAPVAWIEDWAMRRTHAASFLCRTRSDDRVDDSGYVGRHFRIAAIAHPLGVAPVDHETRRFQDAHVARHARLRRAELVHQLANAMLAAIPEDAESGKRVGSARAERMVTMFITHPTRSRAYAQ